jgi:hypothetical protein
MSQLTLHVTGIAIDGVVKLLTVTMVNSTRTTASAPARFGALPHLGAPCSMASINFWTLMGFVLVQFLCFSLF